MSWKWKFVVKLPGNTFCFVWEAGALWFSPSFFLPAMMLQQPFCVHEVPLQLDATRDRRHSGNIEGTWDSEALELPFQPCTISEVAVTLEKSLSLFKRPLILMCSSWYSRKRMWCIRPVQQMSVSLQPSLLHPLPPSRHTVPLLRSNWTSGPESVETGWISQKISHK